MQGHPPPKKKSNIENALWIKKICSDYLFQSHIDQENFLHGRLTLHSTIPPWRRPEGHILSPDILYIGEGKERQKRRTRGGGNHPRKKPLFFWTLQKFPRPKTGVSPKKWPLARKRKFFSGWFWWESCSPGYNGHLFHQQKSQSQYKKLTFGPKYPNFGVKKAHFRP